MSLRRRARRDDRNGVAAVEMVIVCFFLLLPCAYGMIEMARAVQVKECLTDAARSGCRVAITPGKANSDVTSTITTALTANGITVSPTTTIQVNGVTKDCAVAVGGDKVSVKVSVPASSVNYMLPLFMPINSVESETLVMMKQGS